MSSYQDYRKHWDVLERINSESATASRETTSNCGKVSNLVVREVFRSSKGSGESTWAENEIYLIESQVYKRIVGNQRVLLINSVPAQLKGQLKHDCILRTLWVGERWQWDFSCYQYSHSPKSISAPVSLCFFLPCIQEKKKGPSKVPTCPLATLEEAIASCPFPTLQTCVPCKAELLYGHTPNSSAS